MTELDNSLHDSIDRNLGTSAVLESYLHASVLLEQIIPGCVVEEIDGFQHIWYGRPKIHVEHEVVAADGDRAGALEVVSRHPEIVPAYLAVVTRLGSDWDAHIDPGLSRVSRTTVMSCQLPDVVPFSDPSLRRLTELNDLRMLA
ncbi:MAG TPA: hypothetical protein VEX37_12955, partial [Thermomicrobiales bacterium]|nr:hypothetical protein [Thermomicrobiales bacterium]